MKTDIDLWQIEIPFAKKVFLSLEVSFSSYQISISLSSWLL